MRQNRVKRLEEIAKPKKPLGYSRIETITKNEGEPYTEEQLALIAELEKDPNSLLITRILISPKE